MSTQIFEGIKVADFSWIVAAPWLLKYLADHGAEVIHVETRIHADALRTSPPYKDNISEPDRAAYFVIYHCNSYGITINLNHPSGKGIELAKKVVRWGDVVIENFTPGVMDRWGLGYKDLCKIKPDIIMASLSQLGQTGRYAAMPGTGNQLVSLSGFTDLTGYPDRDPSVLYGGFNDTGGARFAAVALIAALGYRQRTGKGQYIDVSQYEGGGIHFLAPLILDYLANNRVTHRNGNRCDYAAPHGVYPCKGDERWCAITVFTDEEWQGLCQAMGDPSLADDAKFATLMARKKNEDELDGKIAEWTRTLGREEVMNRLQKMRVPAGFVNDFRDIYEDPQLTHRGYFREVDHPVLGKKRFESEAFTFSKTNYKLHMPAPLMGQHNEYVLTQILGIPDEEFVELLTEGVLE
jgi:crotonobetainyl-CoA:carnitine CoA-transferase CaiB-like acyl-CoA transferase